MRNSHFSSVLLASFVLVGCGGGGGGNNQTTGSGGQQLSSSEPEPNPPSSSIVTPSPRPEIVVNLQSPGGSRDTDIKYLFQAELDRTPGLEPFLDETMGHWFDLEFLDDTDEFPGLIRVNPASDYWYASPQVDLPNDGEYGFNVERPHKGKGWVVMNSDEYGSFFGRANQAILDPRNLIHISEEELVRTFLTFNYRLNEAIYTGYHQWLRHLDYDPGQLDIGIADLDGAYGAYYSSTNKVFIDEDWLFEVYWDYVHGNDRQWNAALDRLTWLITHEAAHQFGYNNPNGIANGCGGGSGCHAPYGSGSVVSYDFHLGRSSNYGVTEEDVKHIPNATYNDDPHSDYVVTKDSPMGEYGVWITHTFKVTGKTQPGELFGGDYTVVDNISAYGFFNNDDLWDDQLPSGSATYSGEDNFVGADMSHHFLGALLRADANLVYQFGSSTSGDMSLTIDDFEVYHSGIWRTQNGSITYRLGCESNGYCGTEDGYTAESWFGLDSQYVGGWIEDFDNEYVGAFVAEKD